MNRRQGYCALIASLKLNFCNNHGLHDIMEIGIASFVSLLFILMKTLPCYASAPFFGFWHHCLNLFEFIMLQLWCSLAPRLYPPHLDGWRGLLGLRGYVGCLPFCHQQQLQSWRGRWGGLWCVAPYSECASSPVSLHRFLSCLLFLLQKTKKNQMKNWTEENIELKKERKREDNHRPIAIFVIVIKCWVHIFFF